MNEAVRAIKAQVKMEMQNSLTDFRCVDPHKLIDNVEAVLEANEGLQSQLESLKENFPFSENDASMLSLKGKLVIPKSHTMDGHWRSEALREKLRQHEDRLKAQLHHCMSKQADVLSRGRQQTEGSLHSLKRQVDALDDLVSSTSADSTFHFHGSPGIMSHVINDDHKHLKQGKLLD
ncbi:centriolin-like [Bombina bombina]|uniref:centriolin-like n=1 Tax=Bombina bombina TaxID=8345 RepID=UPI00235A7C85|nr:centriolin-like [Bombina bombina]